LDVCVKLFFPITGRQASGHTLVISATVSLNCIILFGRVFEAASIYDRLAINAHVSVIPERSPMPFTEHETCVAPADIAAKVFAMAKPRSS